MSRGINKVILIGNLGNDPEMRAMPSGDSVANLSIATSESWRDKSTGEVQERTEWHRVALFGKVADVAGRYLRKGSKVFIEGKLRTRKWQGQDGQDRYTTEVVVDAGGTMQMLDGRQEGGQGQGTAPPQTTSAPRGAQGQRRPDPQAPPAGGYSANYDLDDDIPF